MFTEDNAFLVDPNHGGNHGRDSYDNPYFGLALQYLPRNIDDMIRWASHFLFRFPFYRAALQRISNYFITDLSFACENEKDIAIYKKAFESLKWKSQLANVGLNILSEGNSFTSITPGFQRFLICPECNKVTLINRIENYTFDKGKFNYTCPACKFKGIHRVADKPIKDVDKLNIVHYAARNIHMRFEETTGASQYFWEMPQDYIQLRKKKNNKFYSKHTPLVIFDCIFAKTPLMVEFKNKNFKHLKLSTPAGIRTGGKAVPYCIYMFDAFFMLKVLERFNEVICFEDINPFRVISMASQPVGQINPILHQDGGQWKDAVDSMITSHRRDPAAYHTFAFPLEFQHLGGDGKTLAPTELIQAAIQNILNALNIPQELYTMELNMQAIGPALRLFENAWSSVVGNYNEVLQHWADVIADLKGLTKATVTLLPTTMADDLQKQNNLMSLMQANAISRTDILKLFGADYEDQVRKRMKEDAFQKQMEEEQQEKDEMAQANKSTLFGQQQQGGGAAGGAPGAGGNSGGGTGAAAASPNDVLEQAQELAQQLVGQEPAKIRETLQGIKAQGNQTLYAATKQAIEDLKSQGRSQGAQDVKQQGQGQ